MATDVVTQIRKATRRTFGAEDKIRIVLEGLRGDIPVTELCRRHPTSPRFCNEQRFGRSRAYTLRQGNPIEMQSGKPLISEIRRLKTKFPIY